MTRTLIYKMTHLGDPDFRLGVWGCSDCEGKVRGYPHDAVIGIGGISREPRRNGIADLVLWVAIGPLVFAHTARGPILRYGHFAPIEGLEVRANYRAIARTMYDTNRRQFTHIPGAEPDLDFEVAFLLSLAETAPPSRWAKCAA